MDAHQVHFVFWSLLYAVGFFGLVVALVGGAVGVCDAWSRWRASNPRPRDDPDNNWVTQLLEQLGRF